MLGNVVSGPGKALELPADFTQYRLLSPFGRALLEVQNDNRELSAFVWTHRHEISRARVQALIDVSSSDHVLWGKRSEVYHVQKAMGRILGITRSQVLTLQSSPVNAPRPGGDSTGGRSPSVMTATTPGVLG